MPAMLRDLRIARALDIRCPTQHVILRVDSEIARAALRLPFTPVPQVFHHRPCKAGAPKWTSVQFDARARE